MQLEQIITIIIINNNSNNNISSGIIGRAIFQTFRFIDLAE